MVLRILSGFPDLEVEISKRHNSINFNIFLKKTVKDFVVQLVIWWKIMNHGLLLSICGHTD